MNRTIRWLLILLYFSFANCCSLVASETTPSAVKILFPPKAVAHVKQHFYLSRPLSPVRLAKLSAGFSSDADGEIVDYRWVVDGTSYRGAEIEIVAFSVPAAKTAVKVQLTVQDNDGLTHTIATELSIENRYE